MTGVSFSKSTSSSPEIILLTGDSGLDSEGDVDGGLAVDSGGDSDAFDATQPTIVSSIPQSIPHFFFTPGESVT